MNEEELFKMVNDQGKKLVFKKDNEIIYLWKCEDDEYPGDFYMCIEQYVKGKELPVLIHHSVWFDRIVQKEIKDMLNNGYEFVKAVDAPRSCTWFWS